MIPRCYIHILIFFQNQLNKELSELSNWFKANKWSANASKTNYMMLGTSHIINKYIDVIEHCDGDDIDIGFYVKEPITKQTVNDSLDNVSLKRVNPTMFLGVIIDEKLTWKNHIDAISKTISRNIGMLTKMKHYVPGYIFYSLYRTLVLPYIHYGILIWGYHLEYSCISTKQIYFLKLFKIIL